MRGFSNLLNSAANTADKSGHPTRAIALYNLASLSSPSWSVPHYNAGLLEKNRGNWSASLAYNQRAAKLNPDDQGAWWNLGIAATALHDWPEALRAWKQCGLTELELRDDQVCAPCGTACVRLNPHGEHPEVVWGTRLDPARIRISNVPFPRSNHRHGDIVLNDGAESGIRTSKGEEYPVFDELALWSTSRYSTFSVTLRLHAAEAQQRLVELCALREMELEDWGTIRMLCEACSRGNPGQHVCAESTDATGDRNFGFAAQSRDELVDVLQEWCATVQDADYSEPRLELLASDRGAG